jgi:hypothetical protein
MGAFLVIPIEGLLAPLASQGTLGLIAGGSVKMSAIIGLYGLLLLGWRRASA